MTHKHTNINESCTDCLNSNKRECCEICYCEPNDHCSNCPCHLEAKEENITKDNWEENYPIPKDYHPRLAIEVADCKGCKKFGKREGCYSCAPKESLNYLRTEKPTCCAHCGKPESHKVEHECTSHPEKERWEEEFDKQREYGGFLHRLSDKKLKSFIQKTIDEAVTKAICLANEAFAKEQRKEVEIHCSEPRCAECNLAAYNAGRTALLQELREKVEDMKRQDAKLGNGESEFTRDNFFFNLALSDVLDTLEDKGE